MHVSLRNNIFLFYALLASHVFLLGTTTYTYPMLGKATPIVCLVFYSLLYYLNAHRVTPNVTQIRILYPLSAFPVFFMLLWPFHPRGMAENIFFLGLHFFVFILHLHVTAQQVIEETLLSYKSICMTLLSMGVAAGIYVQCMVFVEPKDFYLMSFIIGFYSVFKKEKAFFSLEYILPFIGALGFLGLLTFQNTIIHALSLLGYVSIMCIYSMTCLYQASRSGHALLLTSLSLFVVSLVPLSKRPMYDNVEIVIIICCFSLLLQIRKSIYFYKKTSLGAYKVYHDIKEDTHVFLHNNVIHASQYIKKPSAPTAYIHRKGPFGEIMMHMRIPKQAKNISVLGLGAGSIACYATPGQYYSFYEIDPIVKDIAENSRYFTFLSECKAEYDVIIGDALETLPTQQKKQDVLIVDVCVGKIFPAEFLTEKALSLYKNNLTSSGLLIFNITATLEEEKAALAALLTMHGYSYLWKEYTPENTKLSSKDIKRTKGLVMHPKKERKPSVFFMLLKKLCTATLCSFSLKESECMLCAWLIATRKPDERFYVLEKQRGWKNTFKKT